MSSYRYGLHRVANGSLYSDTPNIQEAVWLEDGRLAVGYTGFSSFAPKRGIIRMYERVFTDITYQTFISPPDSADNFSFFGTRLATSGNFLASAFTLTNGSGGVAIFEATNSGDWALRDVAQADVPGTNNNFGAEIHMSGDWLAVRDNSSPGGIYLFKRNAESHWVQKQFISFATFAGANIMALRGDLLAVGQPNNGSGRTHLWRLQPGDTWSFEQTLLIAEGVAQDHFGFSIALGSDQIFVGATGVDGGATDAGALYTFRRVSNSWQRESKITLENPRLNANFGVCVDHSDIGPYLCVGDLTGLHEFTPEGTNWVHVGRNGGGNLFSHWPDSANTYKDYLYGTTNSRPFNPTQRGRQIIARFGGTLSLLEQGHHSIRATPLSITNCYQRPLGYNPIGPDGSPPSDGDNDRIGDMQEIYMGTYLDTNNVLSAAMSPVALPGGGLKVQWYRAFDTNLIVQAEPQWSADLSNWSTNGITVQNLGMAPNEEREILEAQVPPSASRMYFRLRFSLPPGVEED